MTFVSAPISASAPSAGQQPIDAITRARIGNRHLVAVGSLILLLPNVVFALHLAWFPAVAMLVGAGVMVSLDWRGDRPRGDAILAQPPAIRRLLFFFALSIALLILGGEDHIFFANWDWLWRDSVLADLARAAFPPRYHLDTGDFFLRAPLGMYMLPALVAKGLGLGAGHVILLVQNAALLGLVLYMLAEVAKPRAWLAILVFLSFSGLDVVGELVMWLLRGHDLSSFVLPSHIENWAGLQYSSVVTQLFWVPNHALPSYWLMILVLLYARGELALSQVITGVAASLFWSPFAFVGTLPFVAYLFLKDARTIGRQRDFWVAVGAAIGFFPVALYMMVDAAQVPHSFTLFEPFAVVIIGLFLLLEIPHFAIVAKMRERFDPTFAGLVAVALVCLIVLPAFRVGSSGDLVMRGSIPSLFVLAFAFARSLEIAWAERHYAVLAGGLAIVLVGAVTPAQEVIRTLTFPAFAISDCSIVTVWKTMWSDHPTIENYIARQNRLPGWLMQPAPGVPIESRNDVACWPDIPYPARSDISSLSNAMLQRLGHDANKATRKPL